MRANVYGIQMSAQANFGGDVGLKMMTSSFAKPETCYLALLNVIAYAASDVLSLLDLRRLRKTYLDAIDHYSLSPWSTAMTRHDVKFTFKKDNLCVVAKVVEILSLSFVDIDACFVCNEHSAIDAFLLSSVPVMVDAVDGPNRRTTLIRTAMWSWGYILRSHAFPAIDKDGRTPLSYTVESALHPMRTHRATNVDARTNPRNQQCHQGRRSQHLRKLRSSRHTINQDAPAEVGE